MRSFKNPHSSIRKLSRVFFFSFEILSLCPICIYVQMHATIPSTHKNDRRSGAALIISFACVFPGRDLVSRNSLASGRAKRNDALSECNDAHGKGIRLALRRDLRRIRFAVFFRASFRDRDFCRDRAFLSRASSQRRRERERRDRVATSPID